MLRRKLGAMGLALVAAAGLGVIGGCGEGGYETTETDLQTVPPTTDSVPEGIAPPTTPPANDTGAIGDTGTTGATGQSPGMQTSPGAGGTQGTTGGAGQQQQQQPGQSPGGAGGTGGTGGGGGGGGGGM